MLRITVQDDGEWRTLRVEGRLAGDWVGELEHAATASAQARRAVRLDLGGVSYVDAAGARLLRELRATGTELHRCSEFLDALVNGGSKWRE